MTTIDDFEVMRKEGYVVFKHIAGDLSFTYDVVPQDQAYSVGGGRGIGIATNSLEDAVKAINLANKIGYDKAHDYWTENIIRGHTKGKKWYHFGYLPKKQAMKYINEPQAYGEYVERLRKEQHPMRTSNSMPAKISGFRRNPKGKGWFNERKRHREVALRGRRNRRTTYSTKEWFTYNKQGVGSINVFAKTKREALRKARNIHGGGATVEYYKKTQITRIPNL